MGHDIVAKRLNGFARKRLIDALDLLKASDVRAALLEPGQQVIEPLPDGINVPGRDPHG
jgi:hypothetical protein